MKETGIVNIRGKEYQTVAYRVQQFREKFPDYRLITEVIHRDESVVVMKAAIANDDGQVLATGHAEESRTSSQINKTSALENAETSAIGRALAALGMGGTEFASADEVANAIHQQGEDKPTKSVFANAALRKTWCQNVLESLDACQMQSELDTLANLNRDKIEEMKEGGNEHDLLAIDEVRKKFASVKARIKEKAGFEDAVVASFGQDFANIK